MNSMIILDFSKCQCYSNHNIVNYEAKIEAALLKSKVSDVQEQKMISERGECRRMIRPELMILGMTSIAS